MAEELSLASIKEMKKADFVKAFKNKAAWKKAKVFLCCFFIISCNEILPENMPNITLDAKPISTWGCPEDYTPSDLIQVSASQWTVFNSKNYYLSLQEANAMQQNTVAGIDELVRIEKIKDMYLFVSYDSKSRTNKAWTNSTISLEGKQDLALDDPADILYSEQTKKLYWIHSSRTMFVYDFDTKTSTPFLPNQTASDFCISGNGLFLAFQDKDDNVHVVNLSNNEIVEDYAAQESQTRNLVGLTNEGKVLVVNLHIAEKNSSESYKNQVVVLDKANTNPILNINSGWARLSGTNLVAWVDSGNDKKEFQLFDLKEALKY